MNRPPEIAIERALDAAVQSPCAKSKRGVSAYVENEHGVQIIERAFNRPPHPLTCDGSEACRRDCAKRCVHAEVRCVRGVAWHRTPERLKLVHVKAVAGQLVAGDGPSCWQCSREILDAGVAGIWLYELDAFAPTTSALVDGIIHGTGWRYYDALAFHRATLGACEIGGPR
jgi:hypothetical protein